jgi:hypothetical protein
MLPPVPPPGGLSPWPTPGAANPERGFVRRSVDRLPSCFFQSVDRFSHLSDGRLIGDFLFCFGLPIIDRIESLTNAVNMRLYSNIGVDFAPNTSPAPATMADSLAMSLHWWLLPDVVSNSPTPTRLHPRGNAGRAVQGTSRCVAPGPLVCAVFIAGSSSP